MVNGETCRWGELGWRTSSGERCHLHVGYYQWIPYLLLLQVQWTWQIFLNVLFVTFKADSTSIA